jgi:hypothetical protein
MSDQVQSPVVIDHLFVVCQGCRRERKFYPDVPIVGSEGGPVVRLRRHEMRREGPHEGEGHVKALSLRQPWAWAVLNGKSIENRKWNTKFRGEFLIHAAKGMTRDEYEDAELFCRSRGLWLPEFRSFKRGGIVGIATLVDVIKPKPVHDGWQMAGQFGFVLVDVRPLVFVAHPGSLGFFSVPDELVQRLKHPEREPKAANA